MDRLTCMAVFRKVVERHSFSEAAEELTMSAGSVSKYVAALETHIGTPLLARTTRRISLTEAGASYYAKCVRILDDIEEAEKATGQHHPTPRGLLRVRAPISLGSAHLGRTIADFLARFREVKLELTLNDFFIDPAEQGVDVSIAIGNNEREPMRGARPIGRMARAMIAAPAYLRRHGEPATVADLKHHNCLIYNRGQSPDEWHLIAPNGDRTIRVTGDCRCNNSQVLRESLLEGAGIGLLPKFLVADDIASGDLQVVLPEWTPESRTLYAVFPQPRQPSAKVREFVDFVATSFATDSQWRLGFSNG
ncbi:LysR family transcriptional regulator [Variovorax sp. Sphag1AA]|uniref:LysR family transcriptional regulator n=1 Tax=Variovorax sp. Sphag1AA TaxID=2587027 RepID=UPI0016136FF9|nr:LysR family transcriptional regulator [Variovorax sp. Sphag1AA]MBB3181992.1 DNA-binding transcriptional LysR family regulator [Variovorax sp. Sphag1AA]